MRITDVKVYPVTAQIDELVTETRVSWVFLVVETETLRVVTIGKSLCRARRGETASARNISTGREVVGVAVGDSTIQVFLGGPSNGQ